VFKILVDHSVARLKSKIYNMLPKIINIIKIILLIKENANNTHRYILRN
jgi:hypothetical protein